MAHTSANESRRNASNVGIVRVLMDRGCALLQGSRAICVTDAQREREREEGGAWRKLPVFASPSDCVLRAHDRSRARERIFLPLLPFVRIEATIFGKDLYVGVL